MIRPALQTDASAIAAIHVRAWQAAYAAIFPPEFLSRLSVSQRTQFWEQELSGNRGIVLVYEKDDVVAGWISAGESRDASAPGEAEVYAVYVEPQYWNRGIGKCLMEAIKTRLPADRDITLWVLEQNKHAIDFYRTLGYEFDRVRKSFQVDESSFAEVRLRKKRPNQAPEPTRFAGGSS